MNLLRLLQQVFHDALAGLVPDPAPYVALIKPAQDPRHGDYQANCAMPLAKVLGRKPQEVAREIQERLDGGELLEEPEIAGPGFINLRFRTAWLAAQLQKMARDERLGVQPAAPRQDGRDRLQLAERGQADARRPPAQHDHRRCAGPAAALPRAQVITDNHLGDWGTQFGILLYGYKRYRNEESLRKDAVREMARLYVLLRNLMKMETADEEGEPAPLPTTTTRPEQSKPARTDGELRHQPEVHFIKLILPAGVPPPAGERTRPAREK